MQTQTAAKPSQDESRITELLDQFAAALRAKDARAAIACYAHDVVAYDLAPPLRVGDAAVHAPDLLQQWFDTWSSPIVSEGHDLQITVGGDVAYAHGLRHMTGTKKDGQKVDLWFPCDRRVSSRAWPMEDHARAQLGAVRDGRQRSCVARPEAVGSASAPGRRT